ncbi:type IV pilus modification protein PilV [Salinisphaera dokdonensis CL-ES53]|uniref:Type IV pilus modification protein PilV n=1 Tax=Salinisphaera dokdonensis CL-ES53 TaxID=1304272 RepID=A0ABV2B3H2_9GAMM
MTVVIVSIGLLGILGLQTVSIANTASSSARSDATLAADNMADRMRVNFLGARDGAYEGIANPAAEGSSEPKACTPNKTCDPSAMATRDAWEWDKQISERLPNGAGYVDCEESVGGECVSYLITVLWSERDPDRGAGAAEVDMAQCDNGDAMVSGCFQTVVRP